MTDVLPGVVLPFWQKFRYRAVFEPPGNSMYEASVVPSDHSKLRTWWAPLSPSWAGVAQIAGPDGIEFVVSIDALCTSPTNCDETCCASEDCEMVVETFLSFWKMVTIPTEIAPITMGMMAIVMMSSMMVNPPSSRRVREVANHGRCV
jgi:hypothetical protein